MRVQLLPAHVLKGGPERDALCCVILGMGREWDTFLKLPRLLNLRIFLQEVLYESWESLLPQRLFVPVNCSLCVNHAHSPIMLCMFTVVVNTTGLTQIRQWPLHRGGHPSQVPRSSFVESGARCRMATREMHLAS